MISTEQQAAIDAIHKPENNMVLISAVAGSGKTYTLVQTASSFKGKALYLAYNKSAKIDAESKFGNSAECKTIDGLAWLYIVKRGMSMNGIKNGSRTIDYFTWRNIDLDIKYEDKLYVIEVMERYFTSEYISLKEFLNKSTVPNHIAEAVKIYVKKMANKEMPCTFSFSRKYFHILLARGVIQYPHQKLIMLDEIQDSNKCTLEIFKLLPADKKIGVGDMHQSIYAFNYCVNGFLYLQNVVDEVTILSKSYRVTPEIAENIEKFGRKYLDKALKFSGTIHKDTTINDSMYISRTNGSLIAQMIRLNKRNIPYNLSSKDRIQKVFGLLLTIIGLKPGCKVYSPEHNFLLEDMKYYYKHSHVRESYSSLISYIMSKHKDDVAVKSACKTILEFGGKEIYDAYNIAKAHSEAKTKHKLTLVTAHSSKGMEADKVELDGDLFPDFLTDPGKMSEEEIQQELNLIYVAVSRAKKELLNASWLKELGE